MRDQAKWAEKNDIKFHWLPSYASKNPTKENVEKFLNIADDVHTNNKKLFICCERGSDRTGVYSAIYEMTYNKVSGNDAIKKMLKYGHNYYLFDNLIPYIKDYEKVLKTKNITNKIKNFFLHPFK